MVWYSTIPMGYSILHRERHLGGTYHISYHCYCAPYILRIQVHTYTYSIYTHYDFHPCPSQHPGFTSHHSPPNHNTGTTKQTCIPSKPPAPEPTTTATPTYIRPPHRPITCTISYDAHIHTYDNLATLLFAACESLLLLHAPFLPPTSHEQLDIANFSTRIATVASSRARTCMRELVYWSDSRAS